MAKRKKTRESGGQSSPATHGEQRSGPVAGTAIVDGVTFAGKGLQYAEVDGEAMFEGDIVLGSDGRRPRSRTPSSGASARSSVAARSSAGRTRRCRSRSMPALPNQQRVTDAIAHWQANTRIRFRCARDAGAIPNFVRFVPGGGCSSMVGMQGGAQNITLGPNCTVGNTHPRDRPRGRAVARAEPRGSRHVRADRVGEHRSGDAAQLHPAHRRWRRPRRLRLRLDHALPGRTRSRSTARPRSCRARRCRRA